MDKDENDKSRGSSVVPSIMLASFLVVPTALLFVARMQEPYMDEIFHVPQVIKLLTMR